jgi:hypothetical protein
MGVTSCRDCQRFRQHIDELRNRIGELELRLEGARQRERRATAEHERERTNTMSVGSAGDGLIFPAGSANSN